jgi:CheY-like chemotaxis protein
LGQPIRRVLVVDDNRDGANSMAIVLRLLGNDVKTASDGIEAIEIAESFSPEIILMDIGLPRLNGLDATRRIREHPWGETVKIIALTGRGQEKDRQLSQAAGCNGHLVKPVNLPDLQKMLAEIRSE